MTATPWKGKIVLDTIAQYETLVSTGTLVIGGQTITYDPNGYDYWILESNNYTKSETNTLLANKVSTSTTIAGNPLSGDVSASTLLDSLFEVTTVTVDEE